MDFTAETPVMLHSQRLPRYFYQLRTYPLKNPILIAVDQRSLRRIHAHQGVCLYCPDPPETYSLGFCYQREIWILYARHPFFSRAVQLAQAIQSQGAIKIFVLRV